MPRLTRLLVALAAFLLVAATLTSGCGGVYSGPRCSAELLACGQICVDPSRDPENCGDCAVRCDDGELCGDGVCALFCGPGATACGSGCVETAFNPESCGGCGVRCGEGELCSNGVCDGSCTGGTARCDERCRDLAVDPEACGECDVTCGPDEVCASGGCRLDCPSGLARCGDRCVDTRYDLGHCGGCDVGCPLGQLCSGGTCAESCGGGTAACDAHCVDTRWDPAHCGACDAPCPSGKLCSLGECTTECGGGRSGCLGRCVDLAWDPSHCGACGSACEAGDVCSEGECEPDCGGGSRRCGDRCVFVDHDPGHCGGCGKACESGQICSEGDCRLECGPGRVDCGDGVCVDLDFHDDHCGACGRPCPRSQVCWRATCLTPTFSGEPEGVFAKRAEGAPPDLPAISDRTPPDRDELYAGVRAELSSFGESRASWSAEGYPPEELEPAGGLAWVGDALYASGRRVILRYSLPSRQWDRFEVPYPAAEGTQLTHDDRGTVYLLGEYGRVLFFDTHSLTMTRDESPIPGSDPLRPRLAWDRLTQRLYVAPRLDAPELWEYDPAAGQAVELPRSANDAMGTAFCSDGSGHLFTRGDGGSTVWKFTVWDQQWRAFDEAPFSLQPGALCTVFESGSLYFLHSPDLARVRLERGSGR